MASSRSELHYEDRSSGEILRLVHGFQIPVPLQRRGGPLDVILGARGGDDFVDANQSVVRDLSHRSPW